MKMAFRFLLLAAVAALSFWLWTVFFPSPEKVVLKKIAGLAATATFSASDGNITRATKVSRLIGYFAIESEISLAVAGYPVRTLSGREEIREAAAAGFTSLTALNVRFLDVTARVGPDKLTAEVSCTAEVNAGGQKDFGVQEMHFQLKKLDGDWLITKVETVPTLK